MSAQWSSVQPATENVNGIEQQEGTKYFRVDSSCVTFHDFSLAQKAARVLGGERFYRAQRQLRKLLKEEREALEKFKQEEIA